MSPHLDSLATLESDKVDARDLWVCLGVFCENVLREERGHLLLLAAALHRVEVCADDEDRRVGSKVFDRRQPIRNTGVREDRR